MPADAIASFERAMTADNANRQGIAAAAATQLAALLYQQGEMERAVTTARQALEWDSNDAESWNTLGLAQLALQQPEPAVASLTRATMLEPTRFEYHNNLGSAYAATGKLQPAAAAYEKAAALNPDSVTAEENLTQVQKRMDRERAKVSGSGGRGSSQSRPIKPKQIGLNFANLDYRQIGLRGALIKEVAKKSPAARAGLRKGDLLLWIDDYEVVSDKDFVEFVKRNPPGDRLQIEYLRDGRIYEAKLELR